MGFGVMFSQSSVGPGQGEFGGCDFKARRTEILEVRFHRFKTDSMRVDIRVSDVNYNLIMDSDDFRCSISEPGGCVDAGGYQTQRINARAVRVQDWRRVVSWEIGSNGGSGPAALRYQYFGGLAIRKSSDPNAWIGLYPSGPEAN
jgi:hypothetical protein